MGHRLVKYFTIRLQPKTLDWGWMSADLRPQRTTRLGLLFLAVLWLPSCTKPPISDDQFISAFRRDRALFESLVQESYASPFVCPFKSDPDICLPKNVLSLQRRLEQRLGLPVLDVYVKRHLNDSLWIPMEEYGYLSMSSWVRGYVYCKCSLSPLTKDTDQEMENGVWYRPIEDGWMLFIAR